MAVLNGATASPRLMSGCVLTTSSTALYTAPSYTSNVTSPSATAYIKEIILANYTGSATTVNVAVGGVGIISGLTLNAYDTKVLSGLNTMMTAGSTITASAGTASAITCLISGVEVQ
jgi:hypothetical protein